MPNTMFVLKDGGQTLFLSVDGAGVRSASFGDRKMERIYPSCKKVYRSKGRLRGKRIKTIPRS